MKNSLKILIVIALILTLAFFTNPSLQKHRGAIADRYAEENPITGALGVGTLISNVSVSYNNYFFFSTARLEDKTVSIGLFGKVFITQSLDLYKMGEN